VLRWIINSSTTFRLLALAGAAAILTIGVVKLRDAPVDVLPEFAPPTVEVQTEALGLSAPEVEQFITVPMEQDLLNGIAFLKDIRSESVPGLSRILMVFEPGTDLYLARQVVAERLTQAHALPQVSKPPQMLQPISSTSRVMMIGVSSKDVSPIEMSVLARWTIVPRLLGVPGVANVAVWGQRDRQLQVQVDPARLEQKNVSLLQVMTTTANALWVSPLSFVEASTPGTGGFIDTANQRLSVQHLSPIKTAKELAEVPVEGASGRGLRLSDVANVVEDHQPLIGDAGTGDGPGLILVVQKFPGASVLDVTRGVEDAIDAMRPGMQGIEFDTSLYRRATYVEQSLYDIRNMLIASAALMLLALAALVFRWRRVLIVALAIPLSLVAAALVLDALGKTMNALVFAGLLAGLAFVVDEAVIDSDAVARQLRRVPGGGDDSTQRGAAILEALYETRGAALYAGAIIALSVLPLFFLESVAGAFAPDLLVAYLLMLAAAMATALVLTPALSFLLLLRTPVDRHGSPVTDWFRRSYRSVLSPMLARPLPVLLGGGAVVAAGAIGALFLNQSSLPTFKEQSILVQMDGPPGTSLAEMQRVTARVDQELRGIEGVQSVGSHVGRAITGDQVVDVNSSELWVGIDKHANYDSTLARIRQTVASYPGLGGTVQTYSAERVRDELTGTKDDVVVRIFGENQAVLANRAEAVRKVVSDVGGVVNARVDRPPQQPTLQIEVNLDAARRHGIKPGDVRRATAALLAGIQVRSLFENQKVFDVVVWGTPSTRKSLSSIRNLVLDAPERGHVRLGDVADVRVVPGLNVIDREAVSRHVDVLAHVSGRGQGDVARAVDRSLAAVRFPLEYHAETVGHSGQPLGRLLALALAAFVGIVLLLQARFDSWRLALGFVALVPIGVSGGVLAALAAGGTITPGAWIGLLTIFGLCVRWGISLVHELRRRELAGETRGPGLVEAGAGDAMVPTLTAAIVIAAAVLPAAALGDRQGLELLNPLAIVLLGGLVTATALTLLVMPTMYLRFAPAATPPAVEERRSTRRLLAALQRMTVDARRRGAGLREGAGARIADGGELAGAPTGVTTSSNGDPVEQEDPVSQDDAEGGL
jgi:Cu/Ag efflux pump CusA